MCALTAAAVLHPLPSLCILPPPTETGSFPSPLSGPVDLEESMKEIMRKNDIIALLLRAQGLHTSL